MAREAKFYFVPLIAKKQLPTEKVVKVQKPGTLVFSKHTLINIGVPIEGLSLVHLFYDKDKRAIAFRFSDYHEGELPKNVRLFKPAKTAKGVITGMISIMPFIKALKDVHLPTPKLQIKEYNDSLIGPKLMYIVVPKGRQDGGEDENGWYREPNEEQ